MLDLSFKKHFITTKNLLNLGEKKSNFYDLCLNKQSVRSFNENEQYKIGIKN